LSAEKIEKPQFGSPIPRSSYYSFKTNVKKVPSTKHDRNEDFYLRFKGKTQLIDKAGHIGVV